MTSERTELRRVPDRAVTDRDAIHAALDEGLIAHVGLIAGGGEAVHPVVIPIDLYGPDLPRALHVTLHEMPTDGITRLQGGFKVDPVPGL